MEDYKAVEEFFEYLIIDDEGWKGIKTDAPDSAKKAYAKYIKMQEEKVKDGYK